MHGNTTCDTVSIDSRKRLPALLRIIYNLENQKEVDGYDEEASKEAPFLSDGAENKIRTLLRHKTESGLGPVQISLAGKASGTYGNH